MAAAEIPAFQLNTGVSIPSVGLGCFMGSRNFSDKQVYDMVSKAIKAGYRHFDTATGYGNELQVGAAIRDSGVARSEFYITTKLANGDHHRVREAFEESLTRLDLGWIDLYLLHWPQASSGKVDFTDINAPNMALPPDASPTFVETYQEIEKLVETGRVKSIGVSNFSIKTLDELLPQCKIVPATNQVELHPCLPQDDLKSYCGAKGILLSAYSPLVNRKEEKRQKTTAAKDDDELRLESLLFGTKYDDPPTVSLDSKRLRKLRDEPSETTLSGRQYESRLRRQYERIHPQPEWAKAAKARIRDADASGIDQLLSSTSGILAARSSKTTLSSGELAIERLRDANQASAGHGEVKCLAFHPSPSVPVLCVGSADRRIRLFNVDGHTSPLLHTLHIPTLPLLQSSATFHPSGNSLLLTGQRPFYFVYDLQRGEMQHKAGRGLWGSFDSSATVAAPRKRSRGRDHNHNNNGASAEGLEITSFDPRGEVLAVAGRGGKIHLVDWKSGAGQVIDDLKCGAAVKSLWWGSDDGSLVALDNDSYVYVWDIGERRCVRKWKDEGGFRGSVRAMDGSSKGWLAIGSNTGLVNVYGSDCLSQAAFSAQPKPVKTLGHLTTAISTIRFNHDAQLMAVASREKKDALRLIHLPSLTAFSNWPTSSTPLGHVTAVDFSAQSEYLVVGNSKGKVLLYHSLAYGAARVLV
ncbi:Methyltransf-2 domain-containing protein [Mycena chlorophos]|uniref:Methyltransf-2 domain-containing protein n=1 Tax=Mycena chlorophos TaxID=658473 RepID=A0A8H6SG39_MYCCL|nr:Methyltransf-2 domain-containing protein [Mycena chlorophos]